MTKKRRKSNEELEELNRNGYLYCGAFHSSGKYPS